MAQSYDAIVIGAGVVGVSIAFHLAEQGLKPIILERKEIACGATGRSSGLVRMHYDLEAESRLAWVSFQYFRNWRERVGGECGFTRTGFLYIDSPKHNDQMRANVEMHKRIGIPSEVITAGDVKRLVPTFTTDDFEFAAYEPESGYADPVLTSNSLLDAAKRHGAKYLQDCEVTGIRVASGKVTGVQSTRGWVATPVIVNAAGAWAATIAKMVDVAIPLETWTHDVAHLRRPSGVGDHPTVIDGALAMYFRPDSGGLTLVALEDNNRLGEALDSELDYVAKDFVQRVVDRICQRIPAMEAGSLQSTYAGRDGLTPDQHAILGPAGPQGFYLATGFSGTGFKTSPAVGACMSEIILHGRSKTVDVSGFALDRFERGELLKGEHAYGDIWR
jgi:sarcosine oxidase subunit beta